MPLPTMLARIKSSFPNGWAAPDGRNPIVTGVLGGLADMLDWVRDRQAYAVAQTRIKTASTFWLDLIAWDFFGPRFMRRNGELDDPWRKRIIAEIFRPRNTRAAIALALQDLTGRAPELIELWNPGDCGAYDTTTLVYAGDPTGTGSLSGYDCPTAGYDGGYGGIFAYVDPVVYAPGFLGLGRYGSYDYLNQIFVVAHRGVVDVVLLGCGGYDTGALIYAGDGVSGAGFYVADDPTTAATDAEIYATIAATVAGGNVAWVDIEN